MDENVKKDVQMRAVEMELVRVSERVGEDIADLQKKLGYLSDEVDAVYGGTYTRYLTTRRAVEELMHRIQADLALLASFQDMHDNPDVYLK